MYDYSVKELSVASSSWLELGYNYVSVKIPWNSKQNRLTLTYQIKADYVPQ